MIRRILFHAALIIICGTGIAFSQVISHSPTSFSVTLNSCKDSTNPTLKIYNSGASNLTYTISQISQAGIAPGYALYDGFEDGDFNGWMNNSGIYTRQVTNSTAGQGSRSFQLTGGNGTYYDGISRSFSEGRYDYISFMVMSPTGAIGDNCDLGVGDDNTQANGGLMDFWLNNGSMTINVWSPSQGTVSTPMVQNTWYQIEFRNIDYVTKKFDWYVNGVLIRAGMGFWDATMNSINQIYLFGWTNTNAYFDEIYVGPAPQPWANLSIATGTVVPTDSSQVTVEFNSTGMTSGLHFQNLLIWSNDPANSLKIIPCTLRVNGTPDFSFLFPSCLNYGSKMITGSYPDTVYIANSGCDTLFIDSVSNTTSYFAVGSFTNWILPGDTGGVVMLFQPAAPIAYLDTVLIYTNDGDTSVCLSGTGLPAPDISLNPTFFNVTLNGCNDSTTRTLTINNTGTATLNINEIRALNSTGPGVPYLYITNSTAGTVSVVDAGTNSLTGTVIPVGAFPWRAAVRPDGKYLWVSNRDSNSISVIRTSDHVKVKTFLTGGLRPTGIAFTPDSRYAYVGNRNSSHVKKIDTKTYAIIATITAGLSDPQDIAITPDGKYAYVIDANNGVIIIRTSDDVAIANIPGSGGAHSIVITPDGKYAYVSESWNNDVLVIRTADNTVIKTFTGFNQPHGLDLNPAGDTLYVLDKWNNQIDIFEVAGNTFVGSINDGRFNNGWDLVVSGNGRYAYVSAPFNTSTLVVADVFSRSVVNDFFAGNESRGLALLKNRYYRWLTASPETGTVAASGSTNITVKFNGLGLDSGQYISSLKIFSDDPDESPLSVPCTLNVVGVPDILVSDTCIGFDSTLVGDTLYFDLQVTNNGCAPLYITNATVSSAQFSLSGTSGTIAPGLTVPVEVRFHPTSTGLKTGTLILYNNDRNDTICLSGIAAPPPDILIAPATFSVSLSCNDSIDKKLTIKNPGSGNLNFYLIDTTSYDSTITRIFTTSDATSNLVFDKLYPSDSLYLTVRINGDYDSGAESANLYIDGTLIETIPDGNVSNGTNIIRNYAFAGAQVAAWLADKKITVTLDNTAGVGLAGTNIHEARLRLKGVKWLTLSDFQDTISPGDSSVINVRFNSTGLIIGTYYTGIHVFSNDPDEPLVLVPCTLTVTGGPVISVSPSCLNLDSIMAFTTNSKSFKIYNLGCDTLKVTNILSSNGVFTVTTTTLNVLPDDSAAVLVTFSPTAVGTYTANLTVFNNDNNQVVCLSGKAFAQPTVSFNPNAFNITINSCCDTITDTLYIRNTGGSILTSTLSLAGGGLYGGPTFFDGFESGTYLPTWSTGSCGFTNTVTTVSPAVGTRCLQMAGGCGTHYQGLRKNFGTSMPPYISFRVKTNVTNLNAAYVVIGENPSVSTANQMAFFYMRSNGTMGLAGPEVYTPYAANQWYKVEFKNINYTTRRFDFYVNNVLIGANLLFRGTNVTNNEVHLYNLSNTTSWYDEIIFGSGPMGSWLWTNITTGSANSNDSLLVKVNFSSCGLYAGVHTASIVVNSNDPLNPSDTVPVTLTVVGVGEISLSDTCLYLDSIMANTTNTKSFKIYNTGCDTLKVTNITSTNTTFSVSPTVLNVPLNDSALVNVTFSPTSAGTYTATLTVFNNDNDTTLCLSGKAFPRPVMVTTPTSYSVNLSCNDSLTDTLLVINNGGSNLNIDIKGGYRKKKILLLGADNATDLNDVRSKLVATGNFIQVDTWAANTSTPTLAQLMAYDAVLTWSNNSYQNSATLGNNLADYVDAGGGVVTAIFTNGNFSPITGRFGTGGSNYWCINPVNYLTNGPQTLGTVFNSNHPTIRNITSFNGGSSSYRPSSGSVHASATKIANWSDGMPLVVVRNINGSNRVDLGLFPPSSSVSANYWQVSTQGAELMANALMWSGNDFVDWMSVSPGIDTVAANDTSLITVKFNSKDLIIGTYTTSIIVNGNDPLNLSDTIPVTLNVIGASQFDLVGLGDTTATLCLDLDSIMEYTTSKDTIFITNTGCDTLKLDSVVLAPSVFTLEFVTPYILPGDTGGFVVKFSPTTTNTYTGTASLYTNDIDTVFCVKGKSFARPIASVNPTTFTLTLGCNDSTTRALKVRNTGGSKLYFTLTLDSLYSSLPPPAPPLCTPTLTSTCCNMGIFNVTFGSINKTSGNSLEGAYRNHADSILTIVNPGMTYPLSVMTGNSYNERVQAWIDYNDNGVFEGSELIITSQNTLPNRIHTTNVTIPVTANKSRILRMRVGADYFGQPYPQPCANVYYGQFEDYGIIVNGMVTLTPASDSVIPADSSTVTVKFNSLGLTVGTHGGKILVSTNDPLNPQLKVPFTLNVIGASKIELSDTCMYLDSIMEFTTNTDTLMVYNTGCDTLKVTNITSNSPRFTAAPTAFNILPGDSERVYVTFSPVAPGTFSGTITIFNNDQDTTVCLTGKAFARPILTFTPTSYSVSLTGCCDSVTLPLTLTNSGATTPLTYSLKTGKPKVLLLHSNGNAANPRTELINTGLFVNSDFAELNNPASFSMANLDTIDVVMVWTNSNFTNPARIGDTLKKFVDNGGSVVLCTYALSTAPLNGGIFNSNYSPFIVPGTTVCPAGILNLATATVNHPIFEGVTTNPTYWTSCSYSNPLMNTGGTLLGSDLNGNRVIAINPNKRVAAISIYPGNLSLANAAAKRMFANTIYFVAGLDPVKISYSPVSGTVNPSSSYTVNVTFNGCTLTPGVYQNRIIIKSNDPLSPWDTIPVTIVKDTMPIAPVGTNQSVCFGNPTPDLSATGNNIRWYSNPTLTTLVYTGNPFPTGQTAVGTYTYYATQTENGCQSPSDTVTLTINAAPGKPVAADVGSCFGSPTPSLTAAGTFIKWYENPTLAPIVFSSSPFATGKTAVGTYTYYVTDSTAGCPKSPSDTVYLTISPSPSAPIARDTAVCFGKPVPDLTATGTNIKWYSDAGLTILTYTGTPFPTGQTAAGTYTYYVTQTSGGCQGPSDAVVLTIIANPTAPTASNKTACEGGVIPDLTAVGTIVRWYSDAGLTTLVFTGTSFPTGHTAAGVYTYYVTKVNPSGCESPATTVTLTIYTVPAEPVARDTVICFGQTTPSLSSTGSGIRWYSDGALTTLLFSGNPYATVQIAVGTYTYYVTQTVNGCQSVADTAMLTINPLPAKLTASDHTICFGTPTPDLTATGTNIKWYSDPALTTLVFSGSPFATGQTAVGTYNYYVTQTNGTTGCVSVKDTSTLVINAVPGKPVAPDKTSCFGQATPSLTSTGTYIKWFSDAALTTLLYTGSPYASGQTAVGTYTYYVTDSVSACAAGVSDTVYLTIYPIPAAPAAGNKVSCYGDPTPDLTATGTNIKWYSDAGLTTQVFAGSPYATGITAAGTYTYYVTQTVSGCQGPATLVTLTINFTSVPVAADKTSCFGFPTPDLVAAGDSVRWFSDSGLTTLVHVGDTFATGLTAVGTYTYYVIQVNRSTLCSSTSDAVILTINPIPAKPTVNDPTICFGTATPDLSSTGTNVRWYSDGALTTLVFTGNPYATGQTAVGTYTYYATQTVNNCQSPADTSVLTINAIPSIPVARDTAVCFGNPTPDLTAAGSNIKWYSDAGLTTLVFSGSPFPTGQTAVGTYTYYVTQTVTNCPSLAKTVKLTINNIPSAPTTSNQSACFGGTIPNLTATGSIVRWYTDAALTNLVYTGTSFATGQTAVGTYTYYVTDSVSSCSASPSSLVTLTIFAIPAAPSASNKTSCFGSPTPDLTAAGSTIRWYSNPTLTTLVFSGNPYTTGITAAGTYTYYVTQTVNGCESPSDTVILTINSTARPTAIDKSSCFGFPTPDLIAAGDSIRWFSNPPLTTLVHVGDTFATGLTAVGTYTYYIIQVNTSTLCSSASDTVLLTINAIPSAPVASDTAVCFGNPTPNLTATGSNIRWYSDAGLTTLLYSGSSYATGQTAVGTYTYYATQTLNNCQSPADIVILTINAIPVAPIAKDTTVCFGSPVPDLVALGSNIRWFSDAGLTTLVYSGGTFTTGNTAVGTYTYYATQTANNCQSPAKTVLLTINAIPAAPAANDTAVCFGSPVPNLTATGTNIRWYSDAGLTTLVFSGSSFASGQTAVGTYTYYATQTVSSCQSTADVVLLTIKALPAKPSALDTSICFGQATPNLTATGTNIKWYSDGALTTQVGTGPSFATGQTAGGAYAYYVTQTVNGCAGPADTSLLTIFYTAPPLAADTGNCFGNPTPNLTASGSNIKWYSDPSLSTLVFSGSSYATGQTAIGTYTYYVTQTQNNCTSKSDTVYLAISNPSGAPVAPNTVACSNGPIPSLSATGSGTLRWYSDAGLTNLVFSGNPFNTGQTAAGTYTYYVTQSILGCEGASSDTAYLTILQSPAAPLAGDTAVCFGSAIPNLNATGSNIKWYSDSLLTILVFTGPSFSTGQTAVGVYNYFATQTAGNGCASPGDKATLTIKALPSAPLASDTSVCFGNSIPNLTATGSSPMWYSDSLLTTLVFTGSPFTTGQTAAGTYNYFVTQTINGCQGPADTATLAIKALPAAPLARDTSACFGKTIPPLTAAGSSVIWFSDPALTTQVAAGNSFNTGQTAIGTYTYYATQTVNGCQGPADTVTLMISSLPALPAASDTVACFGGVIPPLTATGTGIRWYSDSLITLVATGNTFNTGQSAAGTYTYYVSQSAGACQGPGKIVSLTIKPLPAMPIASDTAVCSGSATPDLTSSGTSPRWYSDTALTTLVFSGSPFPTGNTAAGTYLYYVTQTVNGCEGPADTASLIIYSIPAAPAAANERACQGGAVPDLTATGNAIRWYSDASLTTFVFSGSSFTTGQTAVGTYSYYVTQTVNGCQSPARLVTLDILLSPPVPNAQNKAACFGGTIPSLTATGSTLKWYADSLLTALVFTGSPFNTGQSNPGVYTYFVTDSLPGCVSPARKVTLTINSQPSAPLGTPVTACFGQPVPPLSASGSVPQWYSDPQLVVLEGNGSTFNTGQTAVGTYTYYVTDKVAGCAESTSDTVVLTINPRPLVTLNMYSATIPFGASVTLNTYNGTSYSWAPPTGLNTTTGATVIATPSVTTQYTVTAVNMYGCSKDTSVTITVIPVSIREIGVVRDLQVYPNPTLDKFTIDFNCNCDEAVRLAVFNSLGQLVYSEQLHSTSGRYIQTYDTKTMQLSHGVYNLQLITHGGGLASYKLVVEH